MLYFCKIVQYNILVNQTTTFKEDTTMTDMNKMIDKVRKLLALASNNPSEEEAQAAALRAQKLIAQYNLDMSKETGEKVNYKLVEAIHSNNEGFRKHMAVIIANNFRCKAIMMDNMVNFFGREGDVDACVATFNYLYRVCHNIGERLERQARKEGRSTRGVANSYYQGFMVGLKEGMDAQSKALAIVVPEDVKVKFTERFPNLRNAKGGMRNMGFDNAAFVQGREDGKRSMGRRQLGA